MEYVALQRADDETCIILRKQPLRLGGLEQFLRRFGSVGRPGITPVCRILTKNGYSQLKKSQKAGTLTLSEITHVFATESRPG